MIHSRRSQLLCHQDAQASLWRCPCVDKLRPHASCQHQLASHMSGPLGSHPPAPVKSSDDCNPGQWNLTSRTTWLNQKHQVKMIPKFLREITSAYWCFRLLRGKELERQGRRRRFLLPCSSILDGKVPSAPMASPVPRSWSAQQNPVTSRSSRGCLSGNSVSRVPPPPAASPASGTCWARGFSSGGSCGSHGFSCSQERGSCSLPRRFCRGLSTFGSTHPWEELSLASKKADFSKCP